jgi:hypothetical protein
MEEWKDELVQIGERHRRSTLCRHLEHGIAPSRLNAHIIRELDATEKVLPGVQWQSANTDSKMGPSLPAKEPRPDNDCLTKAIVSSSFIPAFSRVVTHHQNNHALLPNRVQEDLHH